MLHLDLTRVSEQERVQVTVSLELRGEAPGVKEGGMVDHHLFDVDIECPAGEIPGQASGQHQESAFGPVHYCWRTFRCHPMWWC